MMPEERFDILDSAGRSLGYTKARNQVHRDGDWHRTVHVWILRDQVELLMQLRGPNQESNPNKWDVSSAGHCSAGDSSLEDAKREVKEELGWDIQTQDLMYLDTMKSEWIFGEVVDREFSDIYLMRVSSPTPPFHLQKTEVQAVAWCSIQDLKYRFAQHDPTLVEHDSEVEMLFLKLEELGH
jgi:isopentenyldiphosphate isomerase